MVIKFLKPMFQLLKPEADSKRCFKLKGQIHLQVIARTDSSIKELVNSFIGDVENQLKIRLMVLKEEHYHSQGVNPFSLNSENLLRIPPFTLHLPARKQFTILTPQSQCFLGDLVQLNDY